VESRLKLAGVIDVHPHPVRSVVLGRAITTRPSPHPKSYIDPLRLAEARENAKKTGVKRLVRFEEGQLLEADMGSATVVTVYLLPEINMQVRSKLLRELKPGDTGGVTRI